MGDSTFVFAGATVASPIIDTRTLDSNVLIKSGDTLAIGGLLQDEVTKGRTKFRSWATSRSRLSLSGRLNARTKRNLLVFVTPTILSRIRDRFGRSGQRLASAAKNMPIPTAGGIMLKARSALSRPRTGSSRPIIPNRHPAASSDGEPSAVYEHGEGSRFLEFSECGVERGRTLRKAFALSGLQECWPCGLCAMEHRLAVCAPSGF